MINFGETTAVPVSENFSYYFFHRKDIGLVIRGKITKKINSPELQSNWLEGKYTEQDFILNTRYFVRNAQLALILTLSKDNRPFYVAAEKDFVIGVGGYRKSFLKKPSFYPFKNSKNKDGVLTKKDCKKVSIKYLTITDRDLSSITVAINRLLSAVCDRDNPDDVLIDAVMCWENIIGVNGETTFRVCAAAATLLSNNTNDTKMLFKSMKTIYSDRSNLVHGSSSYTQNTEHINQAVYYAAKLTNVVIENEDLLYSTSEERNEKALHIQ